MESGGGPSFAIDIYQFPTSNPSALSHLKNSSLTMSFQDLFVLSNPFLSGILFLERGVGLQRSLCQSERGSWCMEMWWWMQNWGLNVKWEGESCVVMRGVRTWVEYHDWEMMWGWVRGIWRTLRWRAWFLTLTGQHVRAAPDCGAEGLVQWSQSSQLQILLLPVAWGENLHQGWTLCTLL